MADDSHGMGIPLPPDATKIHEFPGVTRLAMERVAEILAGGTTEAAVAAVQSAVESNNSLVLKSDAGAPVESPATGYLEVVTDSARRLLSAVENDGTNYFPLMRHGRRDTADYVEFTVDDVRYKELVLDSNYRILSYVAADGSTPAGTGANTPAAVKPWDVFISAGQSNRYITDYQTVDGIDTDTRVMQWNDDGNLSPTVAGGADHIGWATARHWARSHMDPARVAVWAQSGAGSTGFSSTSLTPAPAGYQTFAGGTWDRTLTDDPKNLALELFARIAAIKAAMPAGSRIFLLWSQGENDRGKVATDGIAWYTSRLDDLLTQARTAAADPAMPVLITDMTAPTITGSTGGGIINEAQEDTPRRLTRTAFVPGPTEYGFRDSDIHWTTQGHGDRGRRLAAALSYARHNVAGVHPSTPRDVKITRHGSEILVKWAPPVSRYTVIRCEISTDAGATWTPAAMRHPLALEATGTASAGAAVRVRLNTTNETATATWQEWKA